MIVGGSQEAVQSGRPLLWWCWDPIRGTQLRCGRGAGEETDVLPLDSDVDLVSQESETTQAMKWYPIQVSLP